MHAPTLIKHLFTHSKRSHGDCCENNIALSFSLLSLWQQVDTFLPLFFLFSPCFFTHIHTHILLRSLSLYLSLTSYCVISLFSWNYYVKPCSLFFLRVCVHYITLILRRTHSLLHPYTFFYDFDSLEFPTIASCRCIHFHVKVKWLIIVS